MGTIEDWFIINTMSFAHPIHIHLINFQVVKVYTLRLFKTAQSTCPYYQLDFVAAAVQNSTATDLQEDVFQDGVVNYTYLCDNIFSVIADRKIVHSLSEIYPENYVENKTSGLDLFVLNEDGSYKYILGPGRPSPKVYYQQWKDTAFVDRY
jgi:FtsP/CotA-like multicopper oxidase with cupredoxin domain